MKREIKFRAWFTPREKGEGKPRMLYLDNSFKAKIHNGHWITLASEGLDLMQFTGLKDKNGKELYESDIVFYEQFLYNSDTVVQKTDIIVYNQCGFCLRNDGSQWFIGDNKNAGRNNFEVIGNIYENPELLK